METVLKSCHLCDAPWMDLSDFSPSQRRIVEAGAGPLGVLAGPGSGKTTVLAGRIAYLVEQRGVPPASIMAITFTTTAAATLRGRLSAVLGGAAGELTITTFHALGLRLIKQWSRELGFGDFVPAVYGRDEAGALLRESAAEFGGPRLYSLGCRHVLLLAHRFGGRHIGGSMRYRLHDRANTLAALTASCADLYVYP